MQARRSGGPTSDAPVGAVFGASSRRALRIGVLAAVSAALGCTAKPEVSPRVAGLLQSAATHVSERSRSSIVPKYSGIDDVSCYGDLDGDGVEDVAVTYMIEEGNSGTQFLLVSASQYDDRLTDLAVGTSCGRVVSSVAIRSGKVEATTREHGPGDACCCPTRAGQSTYVLDGSLLVQSEPSQRVPVSKSSGDARRASESPIREVYGTIATREFAFSRDPGGFGPNRPILMSYRLTIETTDGLVTQAIATEWKDAKPTERFDVGRRVRVRGLLSSDDKAFTADVLDAVSLCGGPTICPDE